MNLLTFAEQLAKELDRQVGVPFAMETVEEERDLLRGRTTESAVRSAIKETAVCMGLRAPRMARSATPAYVAGHVIGIVRRLHPDWHKRSKASHLRHLGRCPNCRESVRSVQSTLQHVLTGQHPARTPETSREEPVVGLLRDVLGQVESDMIHWASLMADPEIIVVVGTELAQSPKEQRERLLRRVIKNSLSRHDPPDAEGLRDIIRVARADIVGAQPN
ncbi:hypothetical protein EPO33_02015 [Patescibacteria group bacterium]|nr:MAG: hypothetical protein EPO33_02015 [Patescibacteria group bacterium]